MMADCVDRSASNGKNGHSNVVSDATSTQLSKRARFQDANEVKNKVAVVLGAQWGDEGKGKVVDMLASSADIVARCQVCKFMQIITTHFLARCNFSPTRLLCLAAAS